MKSKTWPGFGGWFRGFLGKGNNKKAGDVYWMDVSVCFFWMFWVLMILIGVGWRLVGVVVFGGAGAETSECQKMTF